MKLTKRNIELELQTIYALRDIGEATREELIDELKRMFDIEANPSDVYIILKRLKRKKVVTQTGTRESKVTWSIADVPFPPKVDMSMLRGISSDKAMEIITDIEESLDYKTATVPSKLKYRNYRLFKMKFELLDDMLGGLPGKDKDNNILVWPKKNGHPIIPRRWLSGWMRVNGRLINLPQTNLRRIINFDPGVFEGTPEIKQVTVVGLKGPQLHESISAGNTFKTYIRYPMVGTELHSDEDLKKFFESLSVAPLAGLGAFYGARVKLLELTPRNSA